MNRPTPATAPRVQALPATTPARKPGAPKAPIARKPAPKVHEEQYQAPPGGLDDFENGDDGVPRFGPLGLVCAKRDAKAPIEVEMHLPVVEGRRPQERHLPSLHDHVVVLERADEGHPRFD